MLLQAFIHLNYSFLGMNTMDFTLIIELRELIELALETEGIESVAGSYGIPIDEYTGMCNQEFVGTCLTIELENFCK